MLEFVVGDASLWPRVGDQAQHQIAEPRRVTWTSSSLGWMFEWWPWDDEWVCHEVDHGIDAGAGSTTRSARPVAAPAPGAGFGLVAGPARQPHDVGRSQCIPQPGRPSPYGVRAWFEPISRPAATWDFATSSCWSIHPIRLRTGGPGGAVLFRGGGGWFLWTRGGARVTFNRLGGSARQPTPWCARDFVG